MNKTTWKTCQCLITGSKHEYSNEPNQDNVAMLSTNDYVIAVLCDGVSNCPNSHEASEIAVNTAMETLEKLAKEHKLIKRLLDPATTTEIQGELKKTIINTINKNLENQTEGDATLVFAVVLKSFGYAWVGTLGDSAVCVVEKDKSYVLTQTNVYSNGATETIRNENSANLLNTYLLELNKISAIFLTSDGLQGAAYLEDKNNKCYLMKSAEKMVNTVFADNCEKKLKTLLCRMRDNSKISDDDISLAIIASEPITLPEEPTWLCSCKNRNHFMDNRCSNCGKAVFDLYDSAPIEQFDDSLKKLFTYYNSNPEIEYAMVGLRYPDSEISKNNTEVINTEDLKYIIKEMQNDIKNIKDDIENLKNNTKAKSTRNLGLTLSLIFMIFLTAVMLFICLTNNILISEQSAKIDALSEQMSVVASCVSTQTPTETEPTQVESSELYEEETEPSETEQDDNSNDTQLYMEDYSSTEATENENQPSDNWYL